MRRRSLATITAEREAELYPTLRLRPPRPLPPDGRPRRGIAIADTQNKPGAPREHMAWIGRHIAHRRPDFVVHLGDHHDMPSLSKYATGHEREGRRIVQDIEAGNEGIALLTEPIRKVKGYRPDLHVCLGNHENRLAIYEDEHPEVAGSLPEFAWREYGWKVHPFLEVVELHGVAFSHFFPRGPSGRVTQTKNGTTTALLMLKRNMRSCVAGHLQGLDVAIYHDGARTLRGIIAGSCYLHEEPYLSPQGNSHWHGIVELNEVWNGTFDVCEVSLDYLRRRWS